jgi:hypothetical protein
MQIFRLAVLMFVGAFSGLALLILFVVLFHGLGENDDGTLTSEIILMAAIIGAFGGLWAEIQLRYSTTLKYQFTTGELLAAMTTIAIALTLFRVAL